MEPSMSIVRSADAAAAAASEDMPGAGAGPPDGGPSDRLFRLLMLVCVAVFLLLRVPWRDHLLMWDEAMNLCAVRAFVGGGHDPYSEWFWRYPPVFHLLMVAVRPLAAGFVGRVEWIPIGLGLLTLLALAALNRRLFGGWVAVVSAAALAVMPGAVFYGVWIKQDAAMTLFGILALLLSSRGKPVLSGAALGLALLSKQFAVFFAIAIAILLLSERRYRELILVASVSLLTSCWWFLFFAAGTANIAESVLAGAEDCWIHPWHYYLDMLTIETGWPGLLMAGWGASLVAVRSGHGRWPLALLLPTLLVLSAAQCKTPWYSMLLYPAIATCQAVFILRATRWLADRSVSPAGKRGVSVVTALAAVGSIGCFVAGRDYETMMTEREPMMWEASYSSRQAAETLNRCVKPGEAALITTMHYYGANIRSPCPIFVIHLRDMPVLVRQHDVSAGQFVADVRKYRIDWAMVSPAPGEELRRLAGPLIREHGLRPLKLRDALIFRTTPLHAAGPY